jgi:hypothetical protein
MKKMIRRIIPEEDVPAYFNKLHNISGKVANNPPNILVRAGNKVCSISIKLFPITFTLK